MTPVARLCRRTAGTLPADMRPSWVAGPDEVRLAHLGPGPFHRAHQAAITDLACAAAGERWGIATCASRGAATIDALRRQDGLFCLVARDGSSADARVVGSIAEAGPRARFASLLAEPLVTVATLTVTERHYPRRPRTHQLDVDDPLVGHDLAAGTTESLPGLLHAGLLRRWQDHAGPVAVISCDNLRSNGALTRSLVHAFAERVGAPPEYQLWLERSVAFPNTVVDRLVPTPTATDRHDVEQLLGLRDDISVVTETFWTWIIEHVPNVALPPWERAGVRFVADSTADEDVKLHVLNGAHSLLAALGLLADERTVASAMQREPLARAVERFHEREVLPRLRGGGGLEPEAYATAVRQRFANRAIVHQLTQIVGLGSLKLAERIVPLVQLDDDGPRDLCALAIAAWLRLLERDDLIEPSIEPRADSVRAELRRSTTVDSTAAALDSAGLIPRGDLPSFVETVSRLLAELRRGDPLDVASEVTGD